ncbi:dihydrofolate reductase family protein [Georgenia thermotolerans]|uniref:Dihydrofolate reductase n=1 Tax=Georgenia thermotolerans TaxID=527326 RepID=A0A7J5UUU4_9MICO|nr:dihydrofolate reductase family protein [Georgenia thermotolerans]KAE8766064.1 dihydrofolate reductase [Georgenia thermotolerans]
MARVIYNAAATLNGFIADEADSLGWLFAVDGEGAPDNAAFMDRIGALAMGSTTYEWILRQENVDEQPERWHELAYVGDRPTFVFTRRVLSAPPGADVRFVSGAVAHALPELVGAAGGRAVWVLGGGDLAGQFLDAGALDEIQVSLAPATLDGGAPLLPRRVEPDRLRLQSAERHGQFVHVVYAVVNPARP